VRVRSLSLATAAGAALLTAGLLPATAVGTAGPTPGRKDEAGAADLLTAGLLPATAVGTAGPTPGRKDEAGAADLLTAGLLPATAVGTAGPTPGRKDEAGAAHLLTAGLLPATAVGTAGPTPGRAGTAAGRAGTAPGRAGTAPGRKDEVGAADLLAEVRSCARISNGDYRTDAHARPSVPVCGTDDVVFWKADMDIDCDGRRSSQCNRRTDPWFLPETAFRQSDGRPLRSDKLPHVVVPAPSRLWNYARSGIGDGTVAAVIHDGKVRYGVVGDTGPAGVIGEASYAMADSLGIDPDPRTGGTASGVTYILFRNARVKPIEDRAAAVSMGERLVRELVADD
jgi:hypothetical protein